MQKYSKKMEQFNNKMNKEIKDKKVGNRFRNKEEKNKKHKKLKIFGIVIAIILIIVIVLVALVYGFLNSKLGKLQIEQITNDLNELGISEANQDSEMSKYRNIAILGLDSRYDTYDSDYRTDCIMVASINKETNEVQLYSIYRDTYVQMELDGEVIFDKINHAYYNGVENTLKTINKNLDLNITEYVMADFTAIADLVDSVGGIEIDVDSEEINYINDYIKDVLLGMHYDARADMLELLKSNREYIMPDEAVTHYTVEFKY